MPWRNYYGANMIKNPSAEDGLNDWTDIVNVTAVLGGVEGDYCFRFEPTASMKQEGAVPGLPPDVEMGFYFLPGRDIQSAAAVKAQVKLAFIYGDGAILRHVVPGKSFVEGYWV